MSCVRYQVSGSIASWRPGNRSLLSVAGVNWALPDPSHSVGRAMDTEVAELPLSKSAESSDAPPYRACATRIDPLATRELIGDPPNHRGLAFVDLLHQAIARYDVAPGFGAPVNVAGVDRLVDAWSRLPPNPLVITLREHGQHLEESATSQTAGVEGVGVRRCVAVRSNSPTSRARWETRRTAGQPFGQEPGSPGRPARPRGAA